MISVQYPTSLGVLFGNCSNCSGRTLKFKWDIFCKIDVLLLHKLYAPPTFSRITATSFFIVKRQEQREIEYRDMLKCFIMSSGGQLTVEKTARDPPAHSFVTFWLHQLR